jgi:AraC-like DNA-binding protein
VASYHLPLPESERHRYGIQIPAFSRGIQVARTFDQHTPIVATDFDLLHSDTLRFFPELVRELGGDPDELLRKMGLDPGVLVAGRSNIGYRAMVDILEFAATELRCPDLGMRLAQIQGGGRVFGPIGVVMQNCNTLGEALEYVARHIHAHSLAVALRFRKEPAHRRAFIGYEVLLDGVLNKRQAVEQAMVLGHFHIPELTGGRARVREVHFRYQPLSSLRTYRKYFSCEVRFEQEADGIMLWEQDLNCPIVEPDAQLYEIATSFIDTRFPRTPPLHVQVRAAILQSIASADCSKERIAASLGMHPQTLHRRLKAEGKSFEKIKDEVRRDVALGYLQKTNLPLQRIAEKIGYAEASVFTRSCLRWFAASPRALRAKSACQRDASKPR